MFDSKGEKKGKTQGRVIEEESCGELKGWIIVERWSGKVTT